MNLQNLKSKIKSGSIDTVVVGFPDVFGRLVGKRFTASYFLDQVVQSGTHGCNYLLTVNIEMDPMDGFQVANWESGFGDFEMRPDMNSIRELPWQPGAALVICDYLHHDGTAVAETPRAILRGQIERLSKRGFHSFMASELEFYLFHNTYHSASTAGYRNLVPSSDYRIDYHTMQPTRDEPFLRAVRNQMCAAGVPIESSKGEWGRGQHEINFVYDDPLITADRHVVFKQGIKEIAAQHERAVSFMPKYRSDEAGNSCHIHVSLWSRSGNARGSKSRGTTGKESGSASNLFWDSKKGAPSIRFRQFLGGLLKYSPELCYFFAPTINAYKRFQFASWAPTKMAWANDNRTVGFRVVGHGNSFRIENRMPGADANPYLAFAATLVAGMAGIEEELDCGDLYTGNAYTDTQLESLPHSLEDATDRLENSKLARRILGDAVIEYFVHTARLEIQAFRASVTDWERERYFERI